MPRKASTDRARELRNGATDDERALWLILRNRQLAGCKFRRQVPIGRYFADFACFERRVVIELDGSQHDLQQDYDAARTEDLSAQGWLVLRFSNVELREGPEGVRRAILSAIESASGTKPLGHGRGSRSAP